MTAQRVLAVARSQIGTVEDPPGSNRTRYGAAYGMDGVAWCAQFVWWCFREAGLSPLIPKTAYTPTFAAWFKARGQWGTAPRPGAVVFFDFPNDGVNRISHVGLVEAVNADGTVTTIEGNTSSGTTGSQRDGGGVWRRSRKTGVVGYGYPSYETASTEDDLTKEQADQLALLVTQLVTGPDPSRWGWDSFPGGSGDRFTVVDFLRKANQRNEDVVRQLNALGAEVASVKATVAGLRPTSGAGGTASAALSDGDVQRVAAAVVALLGRKTSAP